MTDVDEVPPGAVTAATYAGLLSQLMSNTLDQGYQLAADRRRDAARPDGVSPPSRRVLGAVVVALFGVMLGISALRTEQLRPAATAERDELVAQVQLRQHKLDAMHARLSALEATVGRLQSSEGATRARERQIDAASARVGGVTGAVGVSGPGMEITTDNAPGSGEESGEGIILDKDLQQLVNALWQAGAEAIAINGHRLTSLTAIRTAGQAITVDYRSLTPPYVVDAIGDPSTLPARLLETPGGQAWLGLHENFGIRFDTVTSTDLVLPGETDTTLLEAHPVGRR
jgi:uncharacterized protein YlxW (UPF0749 family)